MLQKVQIILNDALTPYGVASHRLQLYYLVLTHKMSAFQGQFRFTISHSIKLATTESTFMQFFGFSSQQNSLTYYSKIWEKILSTRVSST